MGTRYFLVIRATFKVSEPELSSLVSGYLSVFAFLRLFYFYEYFMPNVLVLQYFAKTKWLALAAILLPQYFGTVTFTTIFRYRYFCEKHRHFCIAIQKYPAMIMLYSGSSLELYSFRLMMNLNCVISVSLIVKSWLWCCHLVRCNLTALLAIRLQINH